MNTQQRDRLPVWRSSHRLVVMVEQSVQGFSRYNKYTLGSELRLSALRCCRLLVRALNTASSQRLRWVTRLQHQVDDVKLLLQVAKELKMFSSFSQFQALSELAVSLGKQVGQWRRKLTPLVPEAGRHASGRHASGRAGAEAQ